MSLLDTKQTEFESTIECLKLHIQGIYKKADQEREKILCNFLESNSKNILSTDVSSWVFAVNNMPLPYDSIVYSLQQTEEQLSKYKVLTEQYLMDNRMLNEDINCLKQDIINFLKKHPTWKLSEDTHSIIFPKKIKES